MTSILGCDISSFQLDACLLIDDQPPVLRRERLGTTKEPLIERVRRVHPGTISKLSIIDGVGYVPPDWLVVEDAYGPSGKARKALDLIAGAIIASAPASSQVALVRCADWRREIGATRNTKDAGHVAVVAALARDHASQMGPECVDPKCAFARLPDLDEHELDAIGIALAWRRILALQATPDEAPNE